MVGKTDEERTKALPLPAKAKSCHLRTVFFYDPEYQTPDRVETWDPVYGKALLRRTQKGSKNPGVRRACGAA